MRSRIGGGLLALGIVALAACGDALAQNREKAWEMYPYVGYVSYGSPNFDDGTVVQTGFPPGKNTISVVTSTIDDSTSFGFRFAYHWTKHQQIEFGFGGHSTSAEIDLAKTVVDQAPPNTSVTTFKSEGVKIDFLVAQINYIYNFFLQRRGKVVAFVSGGTGVVNTSIFGQSADPDMVKVLDQVVGDEVDLSWNFGGGIRLFGGRRTAFRFEVQRFGYAAGRGNQDYLEGTIGLSIVVGGA